MGNVTRNVFWRIAATNGSLRISLTYKLKNHSCKRQLKPLATSVSFSQSSIVNWTSLSFFGELLKSIFVIIVIILLTHWKKTCQKPWNLFQSIQSSVGSITCSVGWKHIIQVWVLQRPNSRWKISVQQLISHTDGFQLCMTDKVATTNFHIYFLTVLINRNTFICSKMSVHCINNALRASGSLKTPLYTSATKLGVNLRIYLTQFEDRKKPSIGSVQNII